MFTSGNNFFRFAAAMALGALVAGCGGVDLGFTDGAGSGVKNVLLGKPTPEPNLPDRAPLVLPPKDASLPVPGQAPQATAVNTPQPPADSGEAKKQTAANSDGGWFSRVFN
jgi:hypothetical protein